MGGQRLGGVKIHQAHLRLPGYEHVFRFEIQVHETAFVDVFQPQRHINEQLGHILRQKWILAGVEFLEVLPVHIFHQQIGRPVNFAVLMVIDHERVMMNARQDLAAVAKPPPGGKIRAQPVMQQPERVEAARLIRRQPDIRHATTSNSIL